MESTNNYIETDLGNVSPNPKGTYSDSEAYEYLDLVEYQGGSYLCITTPGTKITGTAPTPGKNTDTWQILTIPGDLTPEYVAVYDGVIEKSKQVETSRAAAELSQSEVEAAQADVKQMRKDTQEASESAKQSKESAAGYAQSAEVSRQAAQTAEQNATAQVQGFDDHVTEKKKEATQEITTARQSAVNVVTAQGKKTAKELEDIKSGAANFTADAQKYANDASTAASEAEGFASKADASKTAAEKAASEANTTLASVQETKKEINTASNTIKEDKSAIENTKKEIDELKYQIDTSSKQALSDITTTKDAAIKDITDNGSKQATAIEEEGEKQIQAVKDTMPNELNKKLDKEALYDVLHNTPHAETAGDFFNIKRTGKVYRTRIPLFASNPTTQCEKLLDNTGLQFVPSTDTTEGVDDYLNGENPLFEWWDCNYKRYDDGTPYPTAIKGADSSFSYTGNVDVGVIQMSFYYEFKIHEDKGYADLTISDTPQTLRADMVLEPWSECVRADGTVLPYCIGSKYISSVGDDGLLRSVKDGKPENFQSYQNMITNYQKKGTGYWGAGTERNTFQIIFAMIKGATKNSQSLFAGCTSYNCTYEASIERTDDATYFPVTNAQASNLIVGSTVCIGYAGLDKGAANTDRGQANMRKYVDRAKITKIEAIDDNNKAVYLDIENGFPTVKVALSDTVTSPVYLTTMEWYSGTTDNVLGKHDGSMISNTNGKYPYRVQGREYSAGGYMVASDTVMVFKSDYSKDVYVSPKGVKHTTNESDIKKNYILIGNIPANSDGKGNDFWIGDIGINTQTGAWYPRTQGSGSSQGMCDIVYAGGANTSGTREYLQGGYLWHGSHAGFAFLDCGPGLDWTLWNFCAAD